MNIDLGTSYDGPLGLKNPSSDSDAKHYPQFHYSGEKELGLPEEGEMTIRFCVKRETSGKRDDGKHYYECDIAVEKILKVKGEKSEAPARSGSDAASALDKLVEDMGKDKEKH